MELTTAKKRRGSGHVQYLVKKIVACAVCGVCKSEALSVRLIESQDNRGSYRDTWWASAI